MGSKKTPTGAELRARRETLKLSVEWARDTVQWPRDEEDNSYWVNNTERGGWDRSVATSPANKALLAYAAALDAEEARRAEPVPPAGVTVFREGHIARMYSSTPKRGGSIARICDDGTILLCLTGDDGTPVEHVEFVAALSRHVAAQHAASDRQRKLDAVRKAEEALEAAYTEAQDARRDLDDAKERESRASQAHKAAYMAHAAARKEAGLC